MDIEALFNMDNLKVFVAVCISIAGAIKGISALWDAIVNRFGIKTKKMLRQEALEQSMEVFQNTQLEYHKQSIDIRDGIVERQINLENNQSDLKEEIRKLNTMIGQLSESLATMQTRNDFNDRARLKDRISQSYRYYHELKQWNSMEKEAFEDLIRSYEEAGGKNSFIHSICEPESLTWEVIDK